VERQDPADHILINRDSERQVDLICNLGASPGWIALFHLDDSANQIRRLTFWTWFVSLLGRKQQPILPLNQSAMEAQQRGRLEENGGTSEPAWLNPERAESGDEPISDAEIGCSLTRTVHDQQLMFGQNGFGDDSPETSRLSKANKDSDEMEDENGQLAHNSSYSGQIPLQFRLN
jgi:hypothetical protein